MYSEIKVLKGLYFDSRIIETKGRFLVIRDSLSNYRIIDKSEVDSRYFSSKESLKRFTFGLGLSEYKTEKICELVKVRNEKHLNNIIRDLFGTVKSKGLDRYNFLIVESILLIMKNTTSGHEDTKKLITDAVSYFIDRRDTQSLAELAVFSTGNQICQKIIYAFIYQNSKLCPDLIKKILVLERFNTEKLRIDELRFMVFKLIKSKNSSAFFSEFAIDMELRGLVTNFLVDFAHRNQEALFFCVINREELGFPKNFITKDSAEKIRAIRAQILEMLFENLNKPEIDLDLVDKLISKLNEYSEKEMGLYINENCIKSIKILALKGLSKQLFRVAKIAELTTFKSLIANTQPLDDDLLVRMISCGAIEGMSLRDLNNVNILKYLNQTNVDEIEMIFEKNNSMRNILQELTHSELAELFLKWKTNNQEYNFLNYIFTDLISTAEFQKKMYYDKSFIKLIGSRIDKLRIVSSSILPSFESIDKQSRKLDIENFFDVYHISAALYINEIVNSEDGYSNMSYLNKYSEIFNSVKFFFNRNRRITRLLSWERVEFILKGHFGISETNLLGISSALSTVIEHFFNNSDYDDFKCYMLDKNLANIDIANMIDVAVNVKKIIGNFDNEDQLFLRLFSCKNYLNITCDEESIVIRNSNENIWQLEKNQNSRIRYIKESSFTHTQSLDETFSIYDLLFTMEELLLKELSKSFFNSEHEFNHTLNDKLQDLNLDQLIQYLFNIIKDYRSEDFKMTTSRVSKWIHQFDEEDKKNLIIKFIVLMESYYFSYDRVQESIDQFSRFLKEYFCFCCAHPNIGLFEKQIFGSSQNDILLLIKEKFPNGNNSFKLISQESSKFEDCQTFVYVDDAIYTGTRALNEISSVIASKNLKDCKIIVFHIASNESSKKYVESRLNSICKERRISLVMTQSILIKHRITPLGEYFDDNCAWFEKKMEEERFNNDHHDWPIKKISNKCLSGVNTIEDGVEFKIVHKAFMEKGVQIMRNSEYFEQLRPLGYDKFYNYGFGNIFLSYRNISNNSPLVLWFGFKGKSEWLPLFPRKLNISESWRRYLGDQNG